MMRYFLRTLLLTAFIVAAAQSSAFAGVTEPLEIVNETGKTIISLYAVPMRKNGWGNDLVGSGVMNQGDKRSIQYDTSYARYKIKVEFADNTRTFVWYDIDLIDTWRLSIMPKGSFTKNARG